MNKNIQEISDRLRKDYTIDVFTRSVMFPMLSYLNNRNGLRGTLLDLGCGKAEKSNMFAGLGYTVTGIDVTKEYLDAARAAYPHISFVEHDISTLPFPDNSFDVVYSSSVLQYLDYPEVIKEVYRVLRPGGVFVSFENLRGNPFALLARRIYKLFNFYYTSHFAVRKHIDLQDVKIFENVFDNTPYTLHYFILAFVEIFLTGLSYLKIINHYHFTRFGMLVMDICMKIDEPLLKLPFMRRFAWRWLLYGEKNN